MTRLSRRFACPAPYVLALTVSVLAAAPARAGFSQHETFRSGSLTVDDLIGKIRIEGTDGDAFEVDVAVDGKDATRDAIRIERTDGAEPTLRVPFPVDRETRYVYPELGSHSRSTFTLRDDGGKDHGIWSELLGAIGGKKIEVSGSGRGMEAWADVTIKVPRGAKLKVRSGVGATEASDVEADLDLHAKSGGMNLNGIKGELRADTGSGGIEARNQAGKADLETGSGPVTAGDIDGELLVDTGSGSVTLDTVKGPRIHIDTGSGGVSVRGATCTTFYVDTGSGSIDASGISAEEADLDAGSGDITLELVHMGTGVFKLDTGSGSIELAVPKDAGADVAASTGSGSIVLDFPGDGVHKSTRRDLNFRIGDGGAQVKLDTGSGSIKVSG